MRFRSGQGGAAACGPGVALLVVALAAPLSAAPDLHSERPVGTLRIYSDASNARLYYYAPPEIQLVRDSDGKPDFHFLETRYTGTALSKDAGLTRHATLLSFRLELPRIPAQELTQAARTLGGSGRPAEIRPLPIRSLKTALVYATVGIPDQVATPLPSGRFEAAGEGAGSEGAYWTERICTVGLDSLTAQIFRTALESHQVMLSVGYAFVVRDTVGDQGLDQLTGAPALVEELKGQLGPRSTDRDSTAAASGGWRVVRAGAIEIELDTKRWPDLMRRVDLNDRAPPGYAALDVYCYDFNNDLRPDLAEKRVEIDAEAIGGRRVKLDSMFRRSDPDIYSAGVRFPVAVRLDRPYRYRLSETKVDGRVTEGRWREVSSWNRILDVTSPPPTQGVRSILGP